MPVLYPTRIKGLLPEIQSKPHPGIFRERSTPYLRQHTKKSCPLKGSQEFFQQETGTDKGILVTLITVKPIKENAWTDTVSSFVSLQGILV